MADNGARPQQAVFEDHSAGRHALEEVRDVRTRHAEVHVTLREQIASLDTRLTAQIAAVSNDVAESRGAAKGEAATTRHWMAAAALLLTAASLLGPHLVHVGGH